MGYEVAVCDGANFDWQRAIIFTFRTLEQGIDFVEICLEQDMFVQIKKMKKTE